MSFSRFYLYLALVFAPLPLLAKPMLSISVEIPEIDANPYFRPYVAVWLEDKQRNPIKTLALWYQVDTDNVEDPDGKKWLKDLRQWWRKLGRSGETNIDAVTGATRKPGRYDITSDLKELHHGEYLINIEAAREEGSRSYKRVPLTVPGSLEQVIEADIELGKITILLNSN